MLYWIDCWFGVLDLFEKKLIEPLEDDRIVESGVSESSREFS
jgi:hypothetical protein